MLVSISQICDDDIQQNIHFLLEFFTIRLVCHVMKIDVYLTFNNKKINDFIEWMFWIVFWIVLIFIFLTLVLIIQACKEVVFWFAINMKNFRVVNDLLENSRLKRLLQSSKMNLNEFLKNLNAELVRLLWNVKTKVFSRWNNRTSLVYVKTMKLVRMFVEIDASVYDKWNDVILFCMTMINHDVKLIRDLISVKVDVNQKCWHDISFEVIARKNQKKLLE